MTTPHQALPSFRLKRVGTSVFASFMDCNMASAWIGDAVHIFPGKYGEDPVWGEARDLRRGWGPDAVAALTAPVAGFVEAQLPPNAPPGTPGLHGAVWFESMHAAGDTLYALYHNENYPSTLPYDPATGEGYRDEAWPPGLQGEDSIQAVCRIGIMRSVDAGASWSDCGIALADRDERLVKLPINANYTFPGGVGDPSAVACGKHLYIFYGEYAYPGPFDPESWDATTEASGQCISVARLPLADLDAPTGGARRWGGAGFDIPWDAAGQPIASLIIPADEGGGPVSSGRHSFHWGPSVSWNDHLECWVMVVGRVDCDFWAGDSVWISFNPHADLGEGAHSQAWSAPQLLLRKPGHTLWYPSLQPTADPGDVAARFSSVRLGQRARLWVKDLAPSVHRYLSEYEIEFARPAESPPS